MMVPLACSPSNLVLACAEVEQLLPVGQHPAGHSAPAAPPSHPTHKAIGHERRREHGVWLGASKQSLGAGVGKATILVDYEGYSMKNAPAIKTSISCLHIMQNHYPERLAVALCWHAPTLFSVTWKVCTPTRWHRT
jgi:hypothetical protein